MAESPRSGHGWWPYVLPYLSFLLAVEVARRLPGAAGPWMLVVKPALPTALIVHFWRRGAYPELRSLRDLRPGALLQDAAVGFVLALLWMAPYLLAPELRPDPADAFDPEQLGHGLLPLVVALRLLGYACVTPVFEELFIRSFVMRYADVYAERGDFRDVPLARYSLRSFLVTVVVFSVGHVPWEWWVAVPWVSLSNLWFYHRRSLAAVIVLHAVTNASLLGFALFGGGLFPDGRGGTLSLWFFV
jgi:CAAX prenyl protease-like protein